MVNLLWGALVALLTISIGWFFFHPQTGRWQQYRRAHQQAQRIFREDALKYIYGCSLQGRQVALEGLAGTLQLSRNETAALLREMSDRQLLKLNQNTFELTAEGRKAALHIIRAHRLWESYLAQETGYTSAEWHKLADRREHHLTPAELDNLEALLGHPTHDPHGDPIPTAVGEMPENPTTPLPNLELQEMARIVHIEDEPETIYAQIVAEQLHPGMTVQLIEKTPTRLSFWAEGDEHVLAPLLANNIFVKPVTAAAAETPATARLSTLAPGETAEIVSLSYACHGSERRRFMDLGILPGTRIKNCFVSPSGDPTAFQVRNTLIALRKEQADLIHIQPLEASTS